MAERFDGELIGSEHARGRSSDSHDSLSETATIRAEIAEARERMSETLDEIGSRLNPHVVKEQVSQRVKNGIREATLGRVEHMARHAVDKVNEAGNSLADSIRENPVPAAMIAIGLGWMMINRRNSSEASVNNRHSRNDLNPSRSASYGWHDYDSGETPDESERVDSTRERVAGMADGARERMGEVAESARERVSDMTARARERVSEAGHAARERAGILADRARDAAGSVRSQASHLAHDTANRTRRAAVRVEDMYDQNPLALGAVTLALGVVAGLAVPRTDREVVFFGDARDKVVDRVGDVVDETKEKAKHIASRVVDEAKAAAREEGLA